MSSPRIGRPPVPGLAEALMSAAEVIMTRDGYSRLTVDALVGAVGTTRPTFYRRFPGVAHVALAVITQRFGTTGPASTGSLHHDLVQLQRAEIAMFSDPLLCKNLLGLLGAAEQDPGLQAAYHADFIDPRRRHLIGLVEAAAARGELARLPEPGVLDFVCDLLVGPVLARVVLGGGAGVDERLVEESVSAALLVLREHADRR